MSFNKISTDGLEESSSTTNTNKRVTATIKDCISIFESEHDTENTETSNTVTLETILNGSNKEGSTSLMLCIIHDDIRTFQSILQTIRSTKTTTARIDKFLNARNIYGHSALYLSVICRNRYMLAELVELGCNPLVTDREFRNVYHHIARYKLYGYVECIRAGLLRRFEGDIASVNGVEVKLLSARDCEGTTPIHTAIEHSKDVKMLCEIMVPLDTNYNRKRDCMLMRTHKCQSSVLYLAAETGKASLVENVIYWLPDWARKEFLDLQNGCGNTPLHIAVSWNHLKCVELLIAYGAGMRQSNAQNELPSGYCQSDEMRELLTQSRRS